MDVNCPSCGTAYEVEESEMGRKAECEVCGRLFFIARPKLSSVSRKVALSSGSCAFFSVSGVAGRGEFLNTLLKVSAPACVLVLMVMIVVGMLLQPSDPAPYCVCSWLLVSSIFSILSAPVSIRRLHDIGLSGIWYLIIAAFGYFPVFGLIGFLLLALLDSCCISSDYYVSSGRNFSALEPIPFRNYLKGINWGCILLVIVCTVRIIRFYNKRQHNDEVINRKVEQTNAEVGKKKTTKRWIDKQRSLSADEMILNAARRRAIETIIEELKSRNGSSLEVARLEHELLKLEAEAGIGCARSFINAFEEETGISFE